MTTMSAFLSVVSQCSNEDWLCLWHSCHSGISLHQYPGLPPLLICVLQPTFPTFLVYSFFSQRSSFLQRLPKNGAWGAGYIFWDFSCLKISLFHSHTWLRVWCLLLLTDQHLSLLLLSVNKLHCGPMVAMWPVWANHKAKSQRTPVNVLPCRSY